MIKKQIQFISLLILITPVLFLTFTYTELDESSKNIQGLLNYQNKVSSPEFQCTQETAKIWSEYAYEAESGLALLIRQHANIKDLLFICSFIIGIWLLLVSRKIPVNKEQGVHNENS